jgi:uncharacterized repeat protein (TIGR03803 family)
MLRTEYGRLVSRICLRLTNVALVLAVVLMLASTATQSAQAQTFTVLYNFTGGADGGGSDSGLVRDAQGNLYGSTVHGGNLTACNDGCGVIFKVNSKQETVLYPFTGGSDGAYPGSTPVLAASGNLYGTTNQGGSANLGTVFKLSKNGKETVLHSFTGYPDGEYPTYAGLLLDGSGSFYGTTQYGGAAGFGVVYKLDKAGKETILHSFSGYAGSDGQYPISGLVEDTSGNLYGTTEEGGTGCGSPGCGTVYKVNKTTGKETVLYSFTGPPDGVGPYLGNLVMDRSGNLYGTTYGGGKNGTPGGTVFELSKGGHETVLYSFCSESGCSDGASPYGSLIMDRSGNFYGTTTAGGTEACNPTCGTVFKLSKKGKETVLHSFDLSDGAFPFPTLTADSHGNYYATTNSGGSHGTYNFFGVVFEITPKK